MHTNLSRARFFALSSAARLRLVVLRLAVLGLAALAVPVELLECQAPLEAL
jgi:hypothetical protein